MRTPLGRSGSSAAVLSLRNAPKNSENVVGLMYGICVASSKCEITPAARGRSLHYEISCQTWTGEDSKRDSMILKPSAIDTTVFFLCEVNV